MFRFVYPYNLLFLLVIPVLSGLFILAVYLRKKAFNRIGESLLIGVLMPEFSKSRPVLKFCIMMVALALIIIGLARPQFGSKLVKVKRKGIELIIALDVSNSMNAEDIKPSRLERAKQAISKLVDRLDNDRIGLIIFAGDAYTQIPITSDYVSAKMFLSSISSELVPKQGTAIGKAIERAMHSFTPESHLKKVIVVITDGENHEDNPVEIAAAANKQGIRVFTIGIGSPEGTPIPVSPGSPDFMKDREGNVVVSKLDEKTLAEIASAGEGMYVRANNMQFGLNTVMDEIDSIEKKEYEANIYAEYNEQFRYFFIPAFFLLLLEFFITDKKNKFLSRIKLFDV